MALNKRLLKKLKASKDAYQKQNGINNVSSNELNKKMIEEDNKEREANNKLEAYYQERAIKQVAYDNLSDLQKAKFDEEERNFKLLGLGILSLETKTELANDTYFESQIEEKDLVIYGKLNNEFENGTIDWEQANELLENKKADYKKAAINRRRLDDDMKKELQDKEDAAESIFINSNENWNKKAKARLFKEKK